LDLFFLKSGTPTPLAVAASPGDTTLTLTSAAGFVDGTYVFMTSGGLGYFYQGTQLGAPSGNIISLDTPIDNYYAQGVTVIPNAKNMNVDGTVTPQIFQVGPVGPGAGGDADITRVMGYLQGAGSMDDSLFGDQPALDKGIVLRRKYNGEYQNFWNAKTNGELSLICASDFYYASKAPAGSNGARFRATWAGPEKHGVVVRLLPFESIELVIQDDLTGLEVFNMMSQGHFTQE
jgi:hypothetical protein